MGRTSLEDGPSAEWAPKCRIPHLGAGSHSYGRSVIQGFAFMTAASSACARPLLVPGTCDLTHGRTDAFDAAAPWAGRGPHRPAP